MTNLNIWLRQCRTIAAAVAAVLFLGATAADAADQAIGQIKTAEGDVSIDRNSSHVAANVGDSVFAQDVIATGTDGSIGITFTDNTVMSAGPNSEVALEDYAFDSDKFTGTMLTDMRKGTLLFVSGDIARSSPGAMKVRTPTAVLGVRGTRFVIKVGDGQ